MIDAHFHLWRIGENGCRWPTPELETICRNFGVKDIEASARPHAVTGGVLVQSQPHDADTEFLFREANASDFIIAVCGWCALDAPDASARIETLAEEPKLRSLRPMLQDFSDDRWIMRDDVEAGAQAMAALGIAFEALVFPHHLPAIIAFKKKHPGLTVIVNHGAKPQIGDEAEFDGWASMMADIAALPNTFCKLSGLLTEAPRGAGARALRPYLDVLVESFGPRRLMWGSDWPVVNLASDYASWLRLAVELCAGLEPSDTEWIFRNTALSLYGPEGRAGRAMA